MRVHVNAEYACWFFSRSDVADDLPEDTEVGDHIYVTRNLGIDLAQHWEKELGSFIAEEIKAGGLALCVTAPVDSDAENEALKQQCMDVLDGLLLQGVPRFEKGMSMTGANVDGEIKVQSYANLRHVEPTSWEAPEFRLGLVAIQRAVRFGARLRTMQNATEQQWGRLSRGIRALLNANRMSNKHGDRFHQFVSAVEALIKPRQGKTQKDFVHRSQTLAVALNETQEALAQMFDIRSNVEHLHSIIKGLPGDRAERIELANRLTRQIDALARFSFCRVLESETLFNLFKLDEQIDEFWARPDHERRQIWGNGLDIRAVA